MRKIISLVLPLVFLSFCSCGFFFARIAEKMMNNMTEMVNDTSEIIYVSERFKEEHHRWPGNQQEIKEFTKAQNIPFDWARYSHGTFKTRDDGALEISMMYAPPKKGVLSTVAGGPQGNPPGTMVQIGGSAGTKGN